MLVYTPKLFFALLASLLPAIGVLGRSIRSTRSIELVQSSSAYVRRLFTNDCSQESQYPTCNDGSPAGYYLQRPGLDQESSSTTWVIYLEGGDFCTDVASCEYRKEQAPGHLSSKGWGLLRVPGSVSVQGIMSADSRVNPHLHSANKVYVPYCSSDLWSGTGANTTGNMVFSGALIIRAVIADLIQREGMATATRIVFSGSSAGGIGALLHIDYLKQELAKAGATSVYVQGVMDSAWYAHNPANCTAGISEESRRKHCLDNSFIQQMKDGHSLWQGYVPQTCSQASKAPWLCYIASVLRPSVKSDIFVFQWLYDFYYIRSTAIPTLQEQGSEITSLDYHNAAQKVNAMSSMVRRSMRMYDQRNLNTSYITVMVLPTCFSHARLLLDSWTAPMPRDTTLAEIVDCYYAHSIGMPDAGMHDGRCGRRAFYKHTCRDSMLERSSCPHFGRINIYESLERALAELPAVASTDCSAARQRLERNLEFLS